MSCISFRHECSDEDSELQGARPMEGGDHVRPPSRGCCWSESRVIATGTPSGVGFKRNPPIFLKEGDIVEVEIEGIGTIRNPVLGPKG